VLAATSGRGVDVVVDFIGADYFQKNIDVCAVDGRIVMLGLLSGGEIKDGEVDISGILRKRLRIEGSTLRSRDVEYQARLRDDLEKYLPQFETGEFTVVVEKVMSWREIQEAHALLEENKTSGKIICLVD
jgi:NADPH:quinone reductase-like Zn-dependent oxidoreductase